jgi:acetolactate synthase-1/2/3 large subunit
MNVSEAIWSRLSRETDTVFMLPGGGAAFLVDALGRSGLNYIPMLHEQGCAYAAVAYGQLRGLGVCCVTSGPGATNAITGCAAAWTDSAPVIFISGQANSWSLVGNTGLRTRGVQEVDILPMVQPITKLAWRANGPAILGDLDNIISLAKGGRPGPVWLDIPLDVQSMEAQL